MITAAIWLAGMPVVWISGALSGITGLLGYQGSRVWSFWICAMCVGAACAIATIAVNR